MDEVLKQKQRSEQTIILFLFERVERVVLAQRKECFLTEFVELEGESAVVIEPETAAKDYDGKDEPGECEGGVREVGEEGEREHVLVLLLSWRFAELNCEERRSALVN